MLNPCSPCVCSGATCEQCMFGYRSKESNHEHMKELFLAVEAGEKPAGWKVVETYKSYHPDWKKEFPSLPSVEKKEAEPIKPVISDATSDLAREIFERLHAHCKYDGHTVSVWKNDLISIAKEYGVDLTVYEDPETEVFSIGDLVASDRLPNLMGRITKLPRISGRSKGLAVVTVTDWTGKDTTLLVALDKWHKIKEGKA